MDFPILLIIIIALVLILFDFINGFHDVMNSIANHSFYFKVLSPFQAVLWAAVWILLHFSFAAYVIGEFKIGNTIAKNSKWKLHYLRSNFFRIDCGYRLEFINLVVWYSFIIITHTYRWFLGAALMHALVLDYNAVALLIQTLPLLKN